MGRRIFIVVVITTIVAVIEKFHDMKPRNWHETRIIVDRKSRFQGRCTSLTNSNQIPTLIELFKQDHKRLVKSSSHAYIYAWRTADKDKEWMNVQSGHYDCGESGAGLELLKVIERSDVYNVILIVTRWMSGGSIGPKRFKHINEVGKLLLEDFAQKNDD